MKSFAFPILAEFSAVKEFWQYTGKSFSEALVLAATNPQYDKRLFIELRVQCMKVASLVVRSDKKSTWPVTGKSFSEALILSSTNPQYDKKLFIEL